MKKTCILIPLFALLLLSSSFGAGVTDVTLNYLKGGISATVSVDGPVRFQHEIVEPKDGRPYRVIVDILAATHELGKKNFVNLPEGPIERLRTSQYAVSPENIVRLVFDMKNAPVYTVTSEAGAVKVLFTDAGVKPFPTWSSSKYVASIKESVHSPEPATPPSPEMPKSAPSRAEQVNKSIEQDHLASLSADASSDNQKAAKTTPSRTPEKAAETAEPAKKSAKVPSTVAAAEKKATLASKPDKPAVPNDQPASQDVKGQAKTDTFVGPPAPATATAKKNAVATKPATDKPATASTGQKAMAEKVADKPKTAGDASTKTKTASVASKSTPKKPETKTVANAEADDDSNTTSTSRFRRNPAGQGKLKGTMVAEFPKRLVIKYNSGGTRDPFATLIDDSRTNDNPIEGRVPNVEGLRLVGIIQSAGGTNQALFEDKDGYSYILKSGDKVRKGYCLRVEVDRVYFQIFEYGWSRTVALQIED